MTISKELLLSILTMDSYNRGYGSGTWINNKIESQADGLGSDLGIKVGSATISYRISQVSTSFSAEAEAEGFYAIAYDIGDTGPTDLVGQTVIAYRGTDTVGDTARFATTPLGQLNELITTDGAMIVHDDFNEPQFHLASQFYASVAGEKNEITVTGHSLGGALSGFIGQLYQEPTYAIDPINFYAPILNLKKLLERYQAIKDQPNAHEDLIHLGKMSERALFGSQAEFQVVRVTGIDTGLTGPLIGSPLGYEYPFRTVAFAESQIQKFGFDPDNLPAIVAELDNYASEYLEGSVAQKARDLPGVADYIYGPPEELSPSNILQIAGLGSLDAYVSGIAAHGAGLFTILKFASEQPGERAWLNAVEPLLASITSGELFKQIHPELSEATHLLGYSALDGTEGLVFGNTGIRSFFDDGNDLGVVFAGGNLSRLDEWMTGGLFFTGIPFSFPTLGSAAKAIQNNTITLTQVLSDITTQYSVAQAYYEVESDYISSLGANALDGVLALSSDQLSLALDLSSVMWRDLLVSPNPDVKAMPITATIEPVWSDEFVEVFFSYADGSPIGSPSQLFDGKPLSDFLSELAEIGWDTLDIDIFDRFHMRADKDGLTVNLSDRSYDVSSYADDHVDVYIGNQTEKNVVTGTSGDDLLIGGDGDDTFTGQDGDDLFYDLEGNDTYHASDGDTIVDDDGSGRVFLDGIELEGRAPDDVTNDGHVCGSDLGEGPDNSSDNGPILGRFDETYERSGEDLIVTYQGATLTIENWKEGDLGIRLEDDDQPEEWTPPDCLASPLVLDLDGDGIEITALINSDAYFDIDNDGDAERVAWVGADDGILAFDVNGNGIIDDANELFGYGETYSAAGGLYSSRSGPRNEPVLSEFGRVVGPGQLDIDYSSGFDKLAELDLNQDGVINALDTFYNSLIVWRDLNGDGLSDAGELFGLAESGVNEISLTSTPGDRPIEDSIISDTGSYVGTDGRTREVSDVWFRFSQFDARYDDSNVTEAIAALPNIRGTGGLPDLHVAMADDPVLVQMIEELGQYATQNLAEYRVSVQDVLFRWAGVEDVNPFGRGANVDGQRVAFIEVVSDTPFRQWASSNPMTRGGQLIDLQFETILRDMMVRLAGQTGFGAEVISQIKFNNSAFIDLDEGTNSTDMLDVIFDSAPQEWSERIAHIQSGVMMLDRVYKSFADVLAANDDGAGYRADVEARLLQAGFADIAYGSLVAANVGSNDADSIRTAAQFVGRVQAPRELTITRAGNDEVKLGNVDETFLWGRGQGNDELDVDQFFSNEIFPDIRNLIRLINLNRTDVTIDSGTGPISNDIVITINDTGETLTFRNLLLAENLAGGGLEFADGELVRLTDLEPLFTALAEAGSDGDDLLFQRGGTVLDGGSGNDVLRGSDAATTFVFGRGYGVDEIYDDSSFRNPDNTLEFGPGITVDDIEVVRPLAALQEDDLIIRIVGTTDELLIPNQFRYSKFVIETFTFEDGTVLTGADIRDMTMVQTIGNDRLVGSGREEFFGTYSPGNDILTGLGGDDVYRFGSNSGSDIIIEAQNDRYNIGGPNFFSPSYFVENNLGDLVDIDFAFEDLTASRTSTRFTFLHEPSGAQLVVDNTQGYVERYTFAGDFTVYNIEQVIQMIDDAVELQDGSNDSDLLFGDAGGNIIAGGDGDDRIFGLGGPDLLQGDAGDDYLDGGDREDTPFSLQDGNMLEGGTGNDTLLGGWQDDVLRGGDGNDRLDGDFGDDTYEGGLGDDVIFNEDDNAIYIYNLGDGNDLILGTDNRFDDTELRLGAGITRDNISFAVAGVDVDGLTDFFHYRDATNNWSLLITMPDGAIVTLAGSRFADSIAGIDRVVFTETNEAVSFNEILTEVFQPSDADQVFVAGRGFETFALGGGNDYVAGFADTISLGLGDGNNVAENAPDRVVFEGGVLASETTLERTGDRFENLLITLVDGTTLELLNIYRIRQDEFDGSLSQVLNLEQLVFADGTMVTGEALLTVDQTTSAGDDITTGSQTADTLAQSAGNDILRGAGGGDTYTFGIGSGQDTIVETNAGLSIRSEGGESDPFDLSALRENDTLVFGDGLTVDDLILVRAGEGLKDLRIEIAGTTDSITILNQLLPGGNFGVIDGEEVDLERWRELSEDASFYGGGFLGGEPSGETLWGDDPLYAAGIELFSFSNGTTLTRRELANLIDAGENDGDDVVVTDDAGGVLDGGKGNDVLSGAGGDDRYVFDAGYDSDIARDAGGTDEIAFGAGLDRRALTITRTGPDQNDLLIEVGGQERTALYVEGQFAGDGREIEAFTFADGSQLSAEDIRQSLLIRSISNRDDAITGFETSDIIDARRGDDVIEVRGGDDIVDGGDGFDTVVLRGPRSDYIIENEGGYIVVTDLMDRDGINRLYNIERLIFSGDGALGDQFIVALTENAVPIAGDVSFAVNEDGRLVLLASDILANATDPDGASLELVNVGTPSSGTLRLDSDGRYVFEPDADAVEDVTLSYTVRDAAGAEVIGTATITINPINDAPVVGATLSDQISAEDTAVLFTLPADAFADVDADVLQLSAKQANGAALPDWLIFDAMTGTFSGQPPTDRFFELQIVVTARDGMAAVRQGFSLTISGVNDAPVATRILAQMEVREGRAHALPLPADLFEDKDGDDIVLSAKLSDGSNLTDWIVFDPELRVFTVVPPDGTVGTYDVTVVASDGQTETETSFEIVVLPGNGAPEVSTPLPNYNFAEDTEVQFALPTATFSDPDNDTLDFNARLLDGSNLPDWLVFDPSSVSFAGQPPQDLNAAFAIEVIASDGEFAASDSFVLTLAAINDAPVAVDDGGFSNDGQTSLTILASELLSNDTDVDGDPIIISSVSAAIGGQAVLTGTGDIEFTADAGFAGAASFEYTISDGAGGFDTATVGVTVMTNTTPPTISLVGQWLFDDAINPGLDGSSNNNTAEFRLGATVVNNAVSLDGNDDHVFIGNLPAYQLVNATIRMTFTVDAMDGTDSGLSAKDSSLQALFSRDGNGLDNGGHVTAYVDGDGSILVRHQTATDSFIFDTAAGIVTAGEEVTVVYDIQDGQGATLFVEGANGLVEVSSINSDVSLVGNDQPWLLGASGQRSRSNDGDRLQNRLDGTIHEFTIETTDAFVF